MIASLTTMPESGKVLADDNGYFAIIIKVLCLHDDSQPLAGQEVVLLIDPPPLDITIGNVTPFHGETDAKGIISFRIFGHKMIEAETRIVMYNIRTGGYKEIGGFLISDNEN